MSLNQREFIDITYSCAAAFSVWIPKPPQAQKNKGKKSLDQQRQEHFIQDCRSSDSLYYEDTSTVIAN